MTPTASQQHPAELPTAICAQPEADARICLRVQAVSATPRL